MTTLCSTSPLLAVLAKTRTFCGPGLGRTISCVNASFLPLDSSNAVRFAGGSETDLCAMDDDRLARLDDLRQAAGRRSNQPEANQGLRVLVNDVQSKPLAL